MGIVHTCIHKERETRIMKQNTLILSIIGALYLTNAIVLPFIYKSGDAMAVVLMLSIIELIPTMLLVLLMD